MPKPQPITVGGKTYPSFRAYMRHVDETVAETREFMAFQQGFTEGRLACAATRCYMQETTFGMYRKGYDAGREAARAGAVEAAIAEALAVLDEAVLPELQRAHVRELLERRLRSSSLSPAIDKRG